MLHRHHHYRVLLLLVLLSHINGLFVVGHGLVYNLRSIGRHYNVAKQFLDQRLGIVHVDVAHDDDGLVVRAIPFLIIGYQLLGLEIVNDLHLTDWHTVTVLRALE